MEYEVVTRDHSYEVQIDLDKRTDLCSKVDVDKNLWRAGATEEAMRSGKAVMASKLLTNGDTYSDRANDKSWTGRMEKLGKRLVVGKNLALYTDELKTMEDQMTSTSDQDKNYAGYEAVKGRDRHEVQIDLDDAARARGVDVASNMRQAEAADNALRRTK